jgi:hypothetical protein
MSAPSNCMIGVYGYRPCQLSQILMFILSGTHEGVGQDPGMMTFRSLIVACCVSDHVCDQQILRTCVRLAVACCYMVLVAQGVCCPCT